MSYLTNILSNFVSLLYPVTCAGCDERLLQNESSICTNCKYDLPKTNFHDDSNNEVCKLFWGRANIHSATSFFFFNKSGKVQNMIHALKYRSNQSVGESLGKLFGHDLKATKNFNSIDMIIPVPLHKNKLKLRGFNQSEVIAKGLADAMEIPENLSALVRVAEGETQTKKSKFHRWVNIKDAFEISDEKVLKGKHILLEDDVITTGSTLTSCAEKLLESNGTKVSVATLACA